MPRFFFNLAGEARDDQGVELPDIDTARTEAISFLGAYLVDNPGYATQGHWRVEVADPDGRRLISVVIAAVDHVPTTRLASTGAYVR